MGPRTYYAPLWLGTFVSAVVFLTVPGGRSIRGGIAQVAGGLILANEVVGILAGAFYFSSDASTAGLVLFGLSSACLIAALLLYLLNIAYAVHDF